MNGRLASSPSVLFASSPSCRDLLAADHNATNLRRVAPEHQTGAHAKPTDGAVAVHIDIRWSQAVVFQATLNAVKSKLP